LMGGAYLRSRIKQAGKWDQETIVSFFLCQYCSGEYLQIVNLIASKQKNLEAFKGHIINLARNQISQVKNANID
ncbi:hypothetical protein, partial [Aeromonas caviae]|uniref:hypothetical protein n=1 Tax=Aeromonas caviae TaxID=648 RepID=UPI001FC8BA5D